jgi:hypothetical protein
MIEEEIDDDGGLAWEDMETLISAAKTKVGPVALKTWNDEHQCWVGIITMALVNKDGEEQLLMLDFGSAETQVEIDDWADEAMFMKRWEKD